MTMSTQTQAQVPRIGAADLQARLDSGEQATLIDARAPRAYKASDRRIRGAVRIDPGDFHIDESWPRDQLTVVY
jgi:rhodanese-related sulfurtransferase